MNETTTATESKRSLSFPLEVKTKKQQLLPKKLFAIMRDLVKHVMVNINIYVESLINTEPELIQYKEILTQTAEKLGELDIKETDAENDYRQGLITEEEKDEILKEVKKQKATLKKELKPCLEQVNEFYRTSPNAMFHCPMENIYVYGVRIDTDGHTILTDGYVTVEGDIPGQYYYAKSDHPSSIYMLDRFHSLKPSKNNDGTYTGVLIEAHTLSVEVSKDQPQVFCDGVYNINGIIMKDSFYVKKPKKDTGDETKYKYMVKIVLPKNAIRLDTGLKFNMRSLFGFLINENVYTTHRSLRQGAKSDKPSTQKTAMTYKMYGFGFKDVASTADRVTLSYKDFPLPRKHRIPRYNDFNVIEVPDRSASNRCSLLSIYKNKGKPFLRVRTPQRKEEYLEYPILLDHKNASRRKYPEPSFDQKAIDMFLENPTTVALQRSKIRGKVRYSVHITLPDDESYPKKPEYNFHHEKWNMPFRKPMGNGIIGIDPSFAGVACVSLTDGECRGICFERLGYDKYIKLINLNEKSLLLQSKIDKKMEELNPDAYDSENHRPKKGVKKIVITKQVIKWKNRLKEMKRHISAVKEMMLRELAYEVLSMGSIFYIEDISYTKAKERKTGKGVPKDKNGKNLSKRGSGRSIQLFAPGEFLRILTDLIRKNGGVYRYITTKTGCTKHNPFVEESESHDVKDRVFIVNGYKVQRDFFSGNNISGLINIRRINENEKNKNSLFSIDKKDLFIGEHDDETLRKNFPMFYKGQYEEMLYLKKKIDEFTEEKLPKRLRKRYLRSEGFLAVDKFFAD